ADVCRCALRIVTQRPSSRHGQEARHGEMEEEHTTHAQPHDQRGREHVKRLRAVHWTGYVASLLAVVLASAGAGLARYLLGDVNISLIYLIIVVGVATVWGRSPAFLASVPSSACGSAMTCSGSCWPSLSGSPPCS